MAITTNFFNDGTTVYQAEDFIRPWNTLLSPGVFGDSGFKIGATSPASLAVQVTDGKAINGGYFVASDAVETVEITANTSGYNRLDIIVIEIDTTNMKTVLKDVQGVPSSSPTAPN
ncbi:MAG TPA: hypothetical protein DEP42_04895, partial [Ruminococcaceae bacterium]|nr:hypothetical protein [Oscillospiraceae bacterium]